MKTIARKTLLPVMGILMALLIAGCSAVPPTEEATAAPVLPAATETILPTQTTVPAEPTATTDCW